MRPEEGVVGTAGTTGVAGVALELEWLLCALEQRVALGVTITVRVPVPTYLMIDCVAVQVLVILSDDVFVERVFLFGAVICIEEPDWSVKLKVESSFTVMDSTTAVEPEMSTSIPPTLRTTVVSMLTSLAAAKTSEGAIINATAIPIRTSIRGIVSLFN